MENNIINENEYINNENFENINNLNLCIQKSYLVKIENLRYILKLYILNNSELFLLCHFYDTKEDTVFFSSKYSLLQLKNIHKIFKIFSNINDAIKEIISIFDENYSDLSIKVKGFSYDILELSCPFLFLNNNKKDEIKFDLNNIGINKPNIDEYILNEISNLKKNKIKKYEEIKNLKLLNRIYLDRLKELENNFENYLKENNSNKINSNILTKNDLNFLKNIFYKKYNSNNIFFNIIYRATRDGEKVSDFHKKCNNIPRTLIVIKTLKGLKIGGYTEKSWNNEKEEKGDLKEDNNSFVFSLDKNEIYNIKQGEKAIWCHPTYGPCFYGKASFIIYIKDYLLTEPLKTNKLKENVFIGIKYDYDLFNGLENAYAQDIEVFQVIMA